MNAYLSKNITTAATTTVCGTAGVLHSITVNTTAAGTIIYKDGDTVLGTLKASVAEQTFLLDICFNNSLVVVTGAASDVTIAYSVAGS